MMALAIRRLATLFMLAEMTATSPGRSMDSRLGHFTLLPLDPALMLILG
jgi:hypothetical protein